MTSTKTWQGSCFDIIVTFGHTKKQGLGFIFYIVFLFYENGSYQLLPSSLSPKCAWWFTMSYSETKWLQSAYYMNKLQWHLRPAQVELADTFPRRSAGARREKKLLDLASTCASFRRSKWAPRSLFLAPRVRPEQAFSINDAGFNSSIFSLHIGLIGGSTQFFLIALITVICRFKCFCA